MLDGVVDPEARIAQPDMGSDPPRFPRCSCRKVVSGPGAELPRRDATRTTSIGSTSRRRTASTAKERPPCDPAGGQARCAFGPGSGRDPAVPGLDEVGASMTRSRELSLRPGDAEAANEPVRLLGGRPRASGGPRRKRPPPWEATHLSEAGARQAGCHRARSQSPGGVEGCELGSGAALEHERGEQIGCRRSERDAEHPVPGGEVDAV
jgi:hypothetical protein